MRQYLKDVGPMALGLTAAGVLLPMLGITALFLIGAGVLALFTLAALVFIGKA